MLQSETDDEVDKAEAAWWEGSEKRSKKWNERWSISEQWTSSIRYSYLLLVVDNWVQHCSYWKQPHKEEPYKLLTITKLQLQLWFPAATLHLWRLAYAYYLQFWNQGWQKGGGAMGLKPSLSLPRRLSPHLKLKQ